MDREEEVPRKTTFRRCCSAPVLSDLESSFNSDDEEDETQNGLEVFVTARPFREYGGPLLRVLSSDIQSFAVNVGVCHYMTVFRTGDGRLFQFDFGPQGGDIHASNGVLGWLLKKEKKSRDKSVPGEIREMKLVEMPETHAYMGKTRLTLEDIRSFNNVQCREYELHKNDCRHYVNNLVQYTTGMAKASVEFVRETYNRNHGNAPYMGSKLVGIVQAITDVANWQKVKAAGNATVAALFAITGPGAFARARTAAVGIMPALHRVQAARSAVVVTRTGARPVKRAAVAAIATAAASCPEVPVLREAIAIGSMVNEGAKAATVGAITWVESAGKIVAVGLPSALPRPHVVTTASGQRSLALASAVSRGAASFLTGSVRREVHRMGERGGFNLHVPRIALPRGEDTGNSSG